MDNQYRMADEFDLSVPDYVCDEEFLWGHAKDGEHEKADKAAAHAINSHDAMQDRIAELEQLNDELHSLVDKETGLSFTVNNDAVFIDGLGSLPIGTADTVSKQAKRITELEQKLNYVNGCNRNLRDLKAHAQGEVADMEQDRDDLIKEIAYLRAAIAEKPGQLQVINRQCDELMAQNAGLRSELDKTPAACLAEHDVQFLTSLKKKCEGDHPHWGRTHIFLGEQIEQLRQKVTIDTAD